MSQTGNSIEQFTKAATSAVNDINSLLGAVMGNMTAEQKAELDSKMKELNSEEVLKGLNDASEKLNNMLKNL